MPKYQARFGGGRRKRKNGQYSCSDLGGTLKERASVPSPPPRWRSPHRKELEMGTRLLLGLALTGLLLGGPADAGVIIAVDEHGDGVGTLGGGALPFLSA
jgi:hypothetical protein